jgi:hypothetical protein
MTLPAVFLIFSLGCLVGLGAPVDAQEQGPAFLPPPNPSFATGPHYQPPTAPPYGPIPAQSLMVEVTVLTTVADQTQGVPEKSLEKIVAQIGFAKPNDKNETPGMLLMQDLSEKLEKEGRTLRSLDSFKLSTNSGAPSMIQIGSRIPRVSGSASRGGSVQNNVTLENVGKQLGITTRSRGEKIFVELNWESSEMGPEEEGTPVSVHKSDDGDKLIRTPPLFSSVAKTNLLLTPGQPTLCTASMTSDGEKITETMIVIRAYPLTALEHPQGKKNHPQPGLKPVSQPPASESPRGEKEKQ